jgi:hypothetical protein
MRQWIQIARGLVLSAITAMAATTETRAVDGIRIPGLSPILTPTDARARGSTLLFYNSYTGAAGAGQVDANGNYADLRNYPRFDRNWYWIVPTTDGLVLFYDPSSGRAGTARFQADGSYQDLQSFNGFDGEQANIIVSTSDGILLFYRYGSTGTRPKGIAWTGRLDANGNYVRLSEPYLFDYWTNIVPTHDGLVLFYDATTGKAATGRIDVHGGYRDLNNYAGFDPWTHIVSTSNGVLLFYNLYTGAAGAGQVDANGNYSDLRNYPRYDLGWTQIAPTADGFVLFYSANTGAAGTARFQPDGNYQDLRSYAGFDPWTHIVTVR